MSVSLSVCLCVSIAIPLMIPLLCTRCVYCRELLHSGCIVFGAILRHLQTLKVQIVADVITLLQNHRRLLDLGARGHPSGPYPHQAQGVSGGRCKYVPGGVVEPWLWERVQHHASHPLTGYSPHHHESGLWNDQHYSVVWNETRPKKRDG